MARRRSCEGVNVCDTDARILFTNPAFDEMFGYEPGELIDQHASVLSAGTMEDNARTFTAITKALERGEPWRGEISSKKKDGTPFPTYARISVLEVWEDLLAQRARGRHRAQAPGARGSAS